MKSFCRRCVGIVYPPGRAACFGWRRGAARPDSVGPAPPSVATRFGSTRAEPVGPVRLADRHRRTDMLLGTPVICTTWHGMARPDTERHDMARHGMARRVVTSLVVIGGEVLIVAGSCPVLRVVDCFRELSGTVRC